MNFDALILDLNGTVLSDEDEYGMAFNKVLKLFKVKTQEEIPHIRGIGVEENWPFLLKKYKVKTDKDISELAGLTQEEYVKLIPRVSLKKGFERFILQMREKKVKTALATSNSGKIVEKIFERFDIEKYFDCITTGDEVIKKKPDPMVFTLTAEKLGVEKEGCLVIEDSEAGIEAARVSGMKSVGMGYDEKHADTLRKADIVVYDFDGLSFKIVSELF